MPGSGAYSTRSAACAQASPDDDPRLYPAWHDHVVCGTRCDERQVDRAHEARHTHVEWLRFLKQIYRETPEELDVHLIQDNDATHKHPKVKAWLARHPRFKPHFTPTSSSWINLVERFFADLTADVIRSGSFASIGELVRDIEAYLSYCNAAPKPYTWKAEGAAILEKLYCARAALDKVEAA